MDGDGIGRTTRKRGDLGPAARSGFLPVEETPPETLGGVLEVFPGVARRAGAEDGAQMLEAGAAPERHDREGIKSQKKHGQVDGAPPEAEHGGIVPTLS
jgi:hypothetical protein